MSKIKIAVTGGPSGGKTTLIDALQKDLGAQLSVVPEAASILYRGGFPRKSSATSRRHAQRAICAVQRELEGLVEESTQNSVVVCDRGSLDSIAYWPGDEADFFASLNTNRETELARYHWLLHLDTADLDHFDTSNPVRTENHQEALQLNSLIKEAWRGHPQKIVIPHSDDFLQKISTAKKVIKLILSGETDPAQMQNLFP